MNAKNSISWFELTLVTLLTFTATAGALSYGLVSLIGLLHTVALISGFIVVKLSMAKLHAGLGYIAFISITLVLAAEIVIRKTVGLHLNPFVLSLLIQPGASMHIGISLPKVMFLVACIAIILSFANNTLQRPAPRLNYRAVLFILLSSSVAVQTSHAVLYFNGKAEVMSMRRNLPFFYAPHPFYIKTLLTPILGDNGPNPFAAPAPPTASILKSAKPVYPTFTQQKNLLLKDSIKISELKIFKKELVAIYNYDLENLMIWIFSLTNPILVAPHHRLS